MSDQVVRIVHYLNQFFGGIGGEKEADVGLQVREGPVGPGLGLRQALGNEGEIVATLICGDNHFNDNISTVLPAIIQSIGNHKPDVVVAGPAFNAGRYGYACGEVCKAVTEQLKIPAVTAMHPENPAAENYRKLRGVWILPTGAMAKEMPKVLPQLAVFIRKVGFRVELGPAKEEGYIPTGQRRLQLSSVTGSERAIDMLLAKLAGRQFQTEIAIEKFEQVAAAPPIQDLRSARLSVITTSGLVPKGNPDHFKMFNATEWRRYNLPGDAALHGEDWEVIHGGFNTAYAQANPNLVLPLDALRRLSGQTYGELDNTFYTITGVGTSLKVARQAGEEIAASMRESRVDAALLVAT